jgi:pimeloyl-ACP methyl ester carboxylesterase
MLHRSMAGLIVLAALLCGAAHAGMREVKPGEAVVLEADEGLLAIGVDASAGLDYLRIKREGALFDGSTLRRLPKGISMRLFVAPTGRYRFDQLRIWGLRYDLGSDPEYGFDVTAGVLNYPGHLLFHPLGGYQATIHAPNRALLAIDWLEETHPALYAEHRFAYAGHYPDEFPEFYRKARNGTAKVEALTSPLPASGVLPMSVDTLWQPPGVQHADINDAGDLLAIAVRDDLAARPTWDIEVIDLKAGTSHKALAWGGAVDGIEWSGDRSLVLSLSGAWATGAMVIRIAGGPPSPWKFDVLRFPRQGEVVATIPGQPDALLFATWPEHNGGRALRVHKLDISSQKALDKSSFRTRHALDRGIDNDLGWFADGQGRLRAAVVVRDEKVVVLHGIDGKFNPVPGLGSEDGAQPIGMSADGQTIYGYTDKDREQRELVEIDPVTGAIGKTLFSRPGVDVQRALFDVNHDLVGARYYEGGQLVSHYFDAASSAVYAKAAASFPGKTVSMVDRDAARMNYLLLVSASNQMGELFHYDVAANRASLVEDLSRWLDDSRLAASHLVKATSKDGLALEAFLTLPREAKGKVPLVVYPHGGPIGIRDSRRYSPDVQFLASLGYAVLQVNFRGSDGYGNAFRDAGERSYGTRIEDDIDAVLAVVLAEQPVDATRMCAVGSSYGGYSALMSAIRWPERFRCVISLSGISDRTLFFTASDAGRSETGRKTLERVIGDPRKDSEDMRRHSPLYRYAELRAPVMLVHGTKDYRVDYEHTRRLQRMLNLAGVKPVVVSMEGEGHGIADEKIRREVWGGIAGFLRQHLGDPLAVKAATTSPAAPAALSVTK